MAVVMVDRLGEFVWQVPDEVLGRVLDYVMRKVDPTSPFHDLLHAAKMYGKLELFQLSEEKQANFEKLVGECYEQQVAELGDNEETKKVKQLVDLMVFSREFAV